MEKSWKINVEKEGAPCLLNGTVYTADADLTSDPILCTTAERWSHLQQTDADPKFPNPHISDIVYLLKLCVWWQDHRETDDLKLLKQICPVCGNAECKRHRCVTCLTLAAIVISYLFLRNVPLVDFLKQNIGGCISLLVNGSILFVFTTWKVCFCREFLMRNILW